jgi:hypothetical protein
MAMRDLFMSALHVLLLSYSTFGLKPTMNLHFSPEAPANAERKRQMRLIAVLLAIGFIHLTGCNSRGSESTPVIVAKTADAPVISPHFAELSSKEGTFLINESNGQVWRYDSNNRVFLKVALTSDLQTYNPKTQAIEKDPDPATIAHGKFDAFSSNDGTFVIERTTGRSWMFDAGSRAFRELPVTNSVVRMERNSKGELEEVPEKNQSGKPCDKKNDPLCIR